MELSDYGETCTSEMAYYASQETCPSDMANDASQNLIASYEKEEMEDLEIIERRALEWLCKLLEKDEEQINREERERIKYMIYMLLLAIFLGNNDKCKFLATPDRLKISCITVYLLGNDGAHTYNGNGILLTTRRKYTRFKDEELLDEIRPANLPLDVLQRQPTDKEIARLSGRIGQEYRLLAYELGLTRVQLDHLTLDCPTTLLRIERMFFIWRDEMEGNSTFEILVNAMGMHGINTDIVNQSLERA